MLRKEAYSSQLIFKTLSVGPAGIELSTSRTAVRRSPNWANQAAVKVHVKVHVIYEEVAVFSYLERNGSIPIAFLVAFV